MIKIKTRDDALGLLRALRWSIQKSRSTLLEAMGDTKTSQSLLADEHPWLFGPRSILLKLAAYTAAAEAGAPIRGMDLINFVWIANNSEPLIGLGIGFADPRFLDLETDLAWAAQVWELKPATARSRPARPSGPAQRSAARRS